MDLPLLVEGLSGCCLANPLRGTLASPPRFFQRLPPRAMQLHDLSAVHQAPASEGHHVGLLLAPLGQGGGPLLSAAQRVYFLTALNHAAVNQTGDDGR